MSKADEEASWSGLLNRKGVFQQTLSRREGVDSPLYSVAA